MKRLFFLPAVLMLFAGIFTACTDTDEEAVRIDISQDDLTQEFTSAASERFVNLTANKIFDLKSGDKSWCNIARTSNDYRVIGITITVDENLVVEDRETEVTVWTKDLDPVIIKVHQQAATPYIAVTEQSLIIKNNLRIELHIRTNVELDFELPEWITPSDTDEDAGIYRFTATELGTASPRNGNIVVKAKTMAGVTPVTIPVSQEEPVVLPAAPEIPAEIHKAVWSDMYFTPEGYKNRAEGMGGNAPVRIAVGSAGAPESVWSEELKCYVASYPTVNPKKYYTALYTDLDGFKADGYALEGNGAGCTLEFYLKVTNTGEGKRIRPLGSFEAANGNWGIGLEIDDADSYAFRVANARSQFISPQLAPDDNTWDKTKWYHMLFIYDKANDKVGLYVNGAACDERPFNLNDDWKWITLPWQDHHRGIGLGGNYRGLYGNEEADPNPETTKMLLDGMTGEIAFFRWYDGGTRFSAQEVATRYAAIKARESSTKFTSLRTMITETLPGKTATNISSDLKSAIDSAVEMGWNLMGNFETTDATVDAYLEYADKLLNFE